MISPITTISFAPVEMHTGICANKLCAVLLQSRRAFFTTLCTAVETRVALCTDTDSITNCQVIFGLLAETNNGANNLMTNTTWVWRGNLGA